MNDYIKKARITETYDMEGIKNRLTTKSNIRLLHSGMGLVTEAGEFLDMLKKHIFYGKELDLVNLEEEVGDLFWYIAVCLDELGTDFPTVMQKNIAKLKARYPEGFTSEKAINRDLEKEREILEK